MTKNEERKLKKELYAIMHKWSLNNALTKILNYHLAMRHDLDKRCITALAIVLEERMNSMRKNINNAHLIMKL